VPPWCALLPSRRAQRVITDSHATTLVRSSSSASGDARSNPWTAVTAPGPHSVAVVGQRRRAVCRRHVLDAEQLVVRRSLEAGPGNAGSGNGSRPATAVARRRSVRSVAGCRHGRRDRSERRPSSGSLPTISVTTAVVPRRAAPGTSAAVARRQSPSPVGRRVFRSLPKCLPPGASDPSTGPVSPSTHEGRFADRPKSDGRRYRKVWVSIAPVPRGPILGSPYAVLL
jgi:hypothetical protein